MKRVLRVAQGSVYACLIALLACLHLSGCSGGGGGGGLVGGSSARLQVFLTDAPAPPEYAAVHLRIDKVMVVPQGLEGSNDDDPGLLNVPLPNGSMDVDIMQLHFVQQLLGSALIPVGSYNQIRLILAANPPGGPPNNYLVLTGSSEQVPLTTPSAQQTGIKINGHFSVQQGQLNTILLDFNPNTAIVRRGASGQFNIKPTGIILSQIYSSLANAGSISGEIRSPAFNPHSSATFKQWDSAVVSVVPRNPAASAITAGVIFSNFSGLGLWKAPFTAYVPVNGSAAMPSANYKVLVDAGTGFRLYSSQLIDVTTVGVDYPVPPDGKVRLQSAP